MSPVAWMHCRVKIRLDYCGCLACTAPGRLIGRDDRGRELYRCVTDGCDVVEYDDQVFRRRDGAALDPPGRERRGGKRGPAFWTR